MIVEIGSPVPVSRLRLVIVCSYHSTAIDDGICDPVEVALQALHLQGQPGQLCFLRSLCARFFV
jgi:hypothetical protein